MKTFIVGVVLFLFALNVQGQWYRSRYGVNSLNELNEEKLSLALQQTENKIKTGQILTGIGVGSGVIGVVLFANNFCIFSCSNRENFLATTGTVLLFGGFSTMTFGIVKWIVNASRKKKVELALVQFNNSAYSGNKKPSQLGLSIKIHF